MHHKRLPRTAQRAVALLSTHVRQDGPLIEYQRMVGRGQIHSDPHQVQAVHALQRLHASIVTDAAFMYARLCVYFH